MQESENGSAAANLEQEKADSNSEGSCLRPQATQATVSVTKLAPGPERTCLRFRPSRRCGRGSSYAISRLLAKGHWEGLGPKDESHTDDDVLSALLFRTGDPTSIQRDDDSWRDRVDHLLRHLPLSARFVLEKIVPVIESGDSLRELGRKTGLDHKQISRALDAARSAASSPRRRPKQKESPRRVIPYNPRGVPHALYMEAHKGAVCGFFGETDRPRRAA